MPPLEPLHAITPTPTCHHWNPQPATTPTPTCHHSNPHTPLLQHPHATSPTPTCHHSSSQTLVMWRRIRRRRRGESPFEDPRIHLWGPWIKTLFVILLLQNIATSLSNICFPSKLFSVFLLDTENRERGAFRPHHTPPGELDRRGHKPLNHLVFLYSTLIDCTLM